VKYDANIDPTNANTSHVQVLDLVGTGKRVLDVGCSTGYLAQALAERDNTVTGVEVDPVAAEAARPHLAGLLVADLESIDLVAELGQGNFDVIVFADVLEHLTNPLRVLRQAPALLAEGGSVVVSIPNIAHGAVRLALLQGRFEYRDLGLLDDTHVRFFTRSSVNDLHEQAGLTPVDYRRTVADPFATEIPLDPRDFPGEVVDRLRDDPDGTTYQFVIRSVPTPARHAGDDLGEELVARNQELEEARAQLRALTVSVAPSLEPTVGVIVPITTPRGVSPSSASNLDELRAMVVGAELGRRLDGWTIRNFEAGRTDARPSEEGFAIWPLAWSGSSLDAPSSHVDVGVITGTWATTGEAPLIELLAGLGDRGCPAHLAGVVAAETHPGGTAASPGQWPLALGVPRPPGAVVGWTPPKDSQNRQNVVADPLILADRLFAPALVQHRCEYLRFTGVLPAGGPYVLVLVGGETTAHATSVARALEEVAEEGKLGIAVLADPHRDSHGDFAADLAGRVGIATRSDDALSPLDLVAAVAGSDLMVSDVAGMLWLAVALRRTPLVLAEHPGHELATLRAWLGPPDIVGNDPAALLAGPSRPDGHSIDPRRSGNARHDCELFFDELAQAVAIVAAPRLATVLPTLLAEALQREAVLETVSSGLRHALQKARVAFGEQARMANLGEAQSGISVMEHCALEHRLRQSEAALDAARAEIERVHNTRTMRTLAPARRLYGRVRHSP